MPESGGNETIAKYGQEYLTVCMLFSFGQMGQWVFDRFVIASGKSNLFLFTLSAASLTNLILDPIFIFGLFGFPRMETLGAAIATVIGQIAGMTAGILINRKWNKEIPFSFSLRPDRECITAILKVGVPSTLVQILTAVISVAMNSILLTFSTTAVAVYGVCVKIQDIVTVGVHGIDNGLIPIVAYNLGAKKRSRIHDAIKWTVIYSICFYIVFFIGLECVPAMVLKVFKASDYMLAIGVPAVRILAVAYLVSIPSMVFASALQGLSLGARSMYLTMSRQAILPVVFALILRAFGILDAIWSAFVLAELVGIPFAVYLWKRSDSNLEDIP